jgi:mono/diheme cytochrome c family protein
MEETLFYVLGVALVVTALALSAVGLRWESFPARRGIMVGLMAMVGAIVVATGAFAWLNADEEQDEHAAEHAEERQAAFEEEQAEIEAEQVAEEPPPQPGGQAEGGAQAAAAEGEALFTDLGCGGCHTLEAAGSTGTTGPVLDQVLKGKDEAFIRESIVNPNAQIASGFDPDIMPQTYGQDLTPEELDALVAYVAQSTR